MPPLIVLVSGYPGAGKTTLARPLAAELGLTLICKDDIKEALFDALGGPTDDLEYSRRLGVASWNVAWALAAAIPSVVLEANFRPAHAYERGRIAALARTVVEVHCACPPELASARYGARDKAGLRHPVHAVHAVTTDDIAPFQGQFGLGEVVVADTTAPVDWADIAASVRRAIGEATARPRERRFVLMTGYPGAGKSTLGLAVARDLGFGYVCKDAILQIIFDSLGFAAGDFAASLGCGRAAWRLFWLLAHQGRDLVLDSNIKPTVAFERDQARAIPGIGVDLHCAVPPALAQARYFARQSASGHGAIRELSLTDERLASYDGTLGVGRRLVVDTSADVDIDAVVRRVRRAFDGLE